MNIKTYEFGTREYPPSPKGRKNGPPDGMKFTPRNGSPTPRMARFKPKGAKPVGVNNVPRLRVVVVLVNTVWDGGSIYWSSVSNCTLITKASNE